MLTKDDVTKEQFLRYEKIHHSGKYNMITDAASVMLEADLDEDTYWMIIDHYAELHAKFF